MPHPSAIPVIVGVGDLRHGRAGNPRDPREPLELIADAVTAALTDCGSASLGAAIDTVYAIKTSSWNYADLPALIGKRLGANVSRTHTSTVGGHWPAALLDRIGADIAAGSAEVALLVGGEAQASLKTLNKAGTDPASVGWTTAPGGPPTFDATELGTADMQRAGTITPTRVYPLFENSHGAGLGETPAQTRASSARLYAAFSDVAASHPAAWSPVARTAQDIATPGPDNRLVSDAYPLAMNAMPFVDQAAAVVVCSLAAARDHGVAEDRIVYVWGGAGAHEDPNVLARKAFGDSPAMRSATERILTRAGLRGDELSIVDSYCCFPVVPKLLVGVLGLPADAVPSVLGGHSFFGGPLSSYSLHSVVEVTRTLRHHDAGEVAMVHANGGYLTYQHAVLLSRQPHADGYIGDPTSHDVPAELHSLTRDYTGSADIITATIEYDRTGEPSIGFIVAQTPDGRRIAGHTNSDDAAALVAYTAEGTRSLVGAPVRVIDRGGLLTVELEEQANT